MEPFKRKIGWDRKATQQLKQLYTFIYKSSPQNAEKVRNDIVAIIDRIALHPEIYSPDKYKANNDGSFRAFEKHRYRIAYRVFETEIRVLQIRHTSMEPLLY